MFSILFTFDKNLLLLLKSSLLTIKLIYRLLRLKVANLFNNR